MNVTGVQTCALPIFLPLPCKPAISTVVGATGAKTNRWVLAGVAAYMALYTPLDVLMPTLMMGRASAGTPATDFSMQHGIYTSMGLFVAGALAMQAAAAYGYGAALVLSLATSM